MIWRIDIAWIGSSGPGQTIQFHEHCQPFSDDNRGPYVDLSVFN